MAKWMKSVRTGLSMRFFERCTVTAMILMICGICLSVGCKDKQERLDPKAIVKAKAEEYWNKRFLDKDYKATYEMESDKDSIPYEKYLKIVYNAGQIDYVSLKANSVEIDNDNAQVEIGVKCYIAQVPKALNLTMGDQWVFKSNEWRHVLPEKKVRQVVSKNKK